MFVKFISNCRILRSYSLLKNVKNHEFQRKFSSKKHKSQNNKRRVWPRTWFGRVLFGVGIGVLVYDGYLWLFGKSKRRVTYSDIPLSSSSQSSEDGKSEAMTSNSDTSENVVVENEAITQLINDPENVVVEAIEGLLMTSPHLACLDGMPDVKVVIRNDWNAPENRHKVALISGGGSGHEPAHAGLCGPGMLTAAVCGEVFSSPSVPSILAAIRAVGRGHPGVVCIVKNYTGDRLNFGLAAELARAEGIPVEMVIVSDDTALPRSKGVTGARGVAGTVLVHKIAGAVADGGGSLESVAKAAKSVASSIGTIGIALTGCNLPGKESSHHLEKGHMELGLGIHGEPGYKKSTIETVDDGVAQMLEHMLSTDVEHNYLPLGGGEKVAVLVNNLGTCSQLEMLLATRAVTRQLRDRGIDVQRVYTGAYMTSLDMKGLSVTVLKLGDGGTADARLNWLDAPSTTVGWVGSPAHTNHTDRRWGLQRVACDAHVGEAYSRPLVLSDVGNRAQRTINQVAVALRNNHDNLTRWDGIVGDGDCGDAFVRACDRIMADVASYPLNSPDELILAISNSLGVMGGSSGALYQIFLTAAASQLRKDMTNSQPQEVDARMMCRALGSGIDAIKRYGGATEGDRTMLDALVPAHRVLESALEMNDTHTAIGAAVKAAETGAESTRMMAGRAGRSNYISDELLREAPDPGAKAVAIWMKNAYNAWYDDDDD